MKFAFQSYEIHMMCEVLLFVRAFIVRTLYKLGLAGIDDEGNNYPVFSIKDTGMIPSSILIAIVCNMASNSLRIVSNQG